jgi:ketosteroid isomerase-like protein
MTVMPGFNNHKIWFTAFLLLIFAAGCSDPDKAGTNPTLTPPTVISVTPASGAAGVCPNAVITATFSKAMNPSTINATTFTVAPGVTGTITHDPTNTIFTFTPLNPLALSTAYTATITTGATDMFGIALASNFVWTFATGANPCVAPAVISTFPASGAVGVCPNTIVSATFSRAMNPATINATTFTLAGPGTTAVAGVVTYNAASNTATFTPSVALALSTLYTATITTGAKDTFGNALASNFVWTFTTGASLCAPTVVSVTPPNGSSGVCPNTVVTATFSEAMNPSTINTTTFTVTGPGTTPVAGVVTYAASTATFTPNNPLAFSTLYTATITTGAKDLFGVPLASNFVWTFTTSSTPCGPPTVISVAPPNGSSGICPNTVVTATFSEAMKSSTINTTTFTLTGPGTTPVAGVVTYVASSDVATFTPNNALALDTLYTATITTGAEDLAGDPLASDYVWTFTTSTTPCIATVPLGTACSFGILAATPAVTNLGPTVVTGDVGIWPAASITGFPPGTLTGTEHLGDPVAMKAQSDLTTAYNYAAAVPGGAILPADIGGETLPPGVYKTTSAQPSLGITGNLTLSGNANGVWIFQIVSTLTTAAGNSEVILSGGAVSEHVYWQVGSSATLGTNTIFAGTMMAQASVTVTTGATLNGRALARTGAVTLDDNQVNVPPCP